MALLKVTETEGLTVLYGVTSPDSSLASITVDQESPTGEITLNILPGAMARIPPGKYIDGAKMFKEDSDKVLRSGSTIIRNSPVD